MGRKSNQWYEDAVGSFLARLDAQGIGGGITNAEWETIFPEVTIKTLKKKALELEQRRVIGTRQGQAVPNRMTNEQFVWALKRFIGWSSACAETARSVIKSVKSERIRLRLMDGFDELMDSMDSSIAQFAATTDELVSAKVEITLMLEREVQELIPEKV